MSHRLTDKLVKALPCPARGNKITYDSEIKGFGCRVTSTGVRSFVLNYRTTSGRERRYTIGQFPAWKTAGARQESADWKRRIKNGEDPLAEIEAGRKAPTVADLCQRFEDEHLPKCRPKTQRDYQRIIDKNILTVLKHAKVAEVTFSDVDALHRKITKRGAGYVANRTIAVLSKMFSLAIKWGWRTNNPAKGIERNQEHKRERYLSGDEMKRLIDALAEHGNQDAANIIRLLLLTGARRGEVMSMRWIDLDLNAGIWTKPGATTKQKTMHRVPLSAPAVALLSKLRKEAADDTQFVFPGRDGDHRKELKKNWANLCETADIIGVRMHDLRHTYASVLASDGSSLPVIGALLGHTQANTTHRYSHLFDDPLRAATERAAAIVTGKPSAKIVPMKKAR